MSLFVFYKISLIFFYSIVAATNTFNFRTYEISNDIVELWEKQKELINGLLWETASLIKLMQMKSPLNM